MDPLVTLDDVTLAYGHGATALTAIESVSLAIERGEVMAVVGPSGCGKSSLMRLVSGLHRAARGMVRVEGSEVTAPLKTVGMAFQNSNLLPWRTVLDNVLLPLEIVQPHRARIRKERDMYRERARVLLAKVGLADFAMNFPWELSGGMQQRASICRALIHEPEILMLDEPFGALDAFTREDLWCLLRDIQAERRITVLLVTHDLREAVFLADTVYVMSHRPGRIVGRHAVNLPRPRDLDVTFAPAFSAIVHELRGQIGARH